MVNAELTMSFMELRNLGQDQVYVGQPITVCLDCRQAEITIPPEQLEKLKFDASDDKPRGESAKA
jgi:hypothetical protein